jgi:MoaA/NifB/PqqE/SkfB family radical SAM enzyme
MTDKDLDRLTFLGGEPTLHPEITELINDTAEKSITELRMTTNGIGLHNLNLDKLRPGAFDHVSISIDGISPEMNDRTRGKGTFHKILRTMGIYSQAGIPLSINYSTFR